MGQVGVINIILCFILPPLAVFLQRGCGFDLCLSIILSIFFWVPGIIYALWISCSPACGGGRTTVGCCSEDV
ncbi:Proteolipid membrane potential modulator [Plasmodiophora brassicae]|uniref:Uncharacterized protein n=1 Tax=Plasmodiophora brassicae TaxID=37360 RepID=A0A0G4IY66_PLABS|nr:hypothetical protein PBRA_007994 [Plasmodiophora brassicae]